MVKINFHMHSTGSDGHSTPEEVVKEAIRQGINFMCFTDHYRRPEGIDTGWDTTNFHSKAYLAEIKNLQEKYKDKIDISLGAEFDWLPNHTAWIGQEILNGNYDFVMGSIHIIFSGKRYTQFMFSNGQGNKWLASSNNFGSPRKMTEHYYKNLREMIGSGLFDSVGHFDVIKMHNKNSMFFSEEEKWYKKEVLKTLDLLRKSGMVMEINTSGLVREVMAQYPSLWILEEAKKREIPITIGTDAHNNEQIGKELDFAYDLARKVGYRHIVRFKDRKRIMISIKKDDIKSKAH